MDQHQERQLLQWLAEIENEERNQTLENLDDSEGSEIDAVEIQNYNTDSEISASSEDDEESIPNRPVIVSRRPTYLGMKLFKYLIINPFQQNCLLSGRDNQTVWDIHYENRHAKTPVRNIVTRKRGVKGSAKEKKIPSECWSLYIPDDLVGKIVIYTNKYISKIRQNISRPRDATDTNLDEIKALFGLLYLAGTWKSSHVSVDDLWAADGPVIFRITMGKNRFRLLLRALRFDDFTDREERKKTDKLAPIREVFDSFVEKCKANYEIGQYATIDEMLEAFRGKCSFRQYIPSKPAKYGIKIYSLADAENWYTSNLEVYVGKQPNGPFQQDNNSAALVKRLVEPIANTGRNVTCDNFFTSVPLAVDLLNNMRTTLVGTLRKNKREIPPIFIATKERPQNTSMFAFGKECLLTSYVPKKNKYVLVLSTMHDKDIIDPRTGNAQKPEVITFYNQTKSGVDVVDKLKSLYSVSRISCRWPLTIFFSVLNICGINCQIIYYENTGIEMPRRKFLKQLAFELIRPHQMLRANIRTLPVLLRMQIKDHLGIQDEAEPLEMERESNKCAYCPKRKNRKTQTKCCKPNCGKPICKEHTTTLCNSCWEIEEEESE